MSIDSFFIHQHCLMSNPLHSLMPDLLRHQGVWEGTYRHVDISGNLLDKYRSRIECIFPEEGQEVYIQKNTYTWPDGRTIETSFGSIIKSINSSGTHRLSQDMAGLLSQIPLFWI